MKKLILILFCFPLIVCGQIYLGNNQEICQGDEAQLIATYAPGTSVSWTGSPVLITECDPGSPDIIEIQNVSSSPVDVTGWRVIISNSYTNITLSNSIEQVLSGIMISEEIKNWSDGSTTANYWGNNILWNPGAYPSFAGWIILLDDNNNVMDVFVGNWLAADIASSAIVTSVGTISLLDHWDGDGVDQTNIASSQQSFSRVGNDDNNNASDFIISSTSSGSTNIGLDLPFSGGGATWYDQSTNQLIGGGDTIYYSPSQSTYILAQITDTLGQTYSDSMYVEVFNTNISSIGTSLCAGSLDLTAPNIFSTYNWSNGASGSNQITVNSPGIYFVDYTTSNGLTCESDTITIYPGNIPITLSTPDSVFICQGDIVTIDGPPGFSQYNWSTGATTSSITTTLTGNYSLSVIDVNGCTGTSNTTSVSISPPTITATTTGLSLCNGSVTLDAGLGFSSYQWYNNSALMSITAQTLVVINAGSYHVEVTYPTGCTATSNTLAIIAGTSQFTFSIDSIGDGSLCLPNGQVILDAGNYATYSWNSGDTTQQISVNTEGHYTVEVTDANGCEGASDSAFVVSNIVNTSDISGPLSPTLFQSVTYSVNPTVGSTYTWTLIGGTITGQGTNSIDVIWNFTGTFYFSVIETDVNGCIGEEVLSPLIDVITISFVEETNTKNRKITKITDLLGREIIPTINTPFIKSYDDGTVEKRIIME